MQSWVYYHVVIGLLCFEYGYLQKLEKECSWLVERDHCPFYGSTDWECLKARLNCAVGKRYHCAKNETGSWVEVCDKGTVCSEGEEPVYLKDLSIHCEPCSDPERYQPFSKSSYIFSQCERKKKPCPEGVSHECANEAGRYTQNRKCMCTYKKDYIPQDYDFTKYKWVCADPDDLNCVAEACPESVDGKPQARGGDYRCSPSSLVTPSPTKNPNERSTTEHILPTKTTDTERNDTERTTERISGQPTTIIIVAILDIVFLVIWIVGLWLWKRLHRYKKLEPPRCLNVKEIWYTHIILEWQSPDSDDGRQVNCYILDQKENESNHWTRVTTVSVADEDCCHIENVHDEHSDGDENICLTDNIVKYKVEGLTAGTSYKFRVAAKNKKGVGSFLEQESPVTTKHYTAPEKPHNVIAKFKKETMSMEVSWEKPFDGGLQILNYLLEYSKLVCKDWIEADVVVKGTMWTSKTLEPGTKYVFRVCARNEKGYSEPQETWQAEQFLSVPSEPTSVIVMDIKSDKVALKWDAPKTDGGSHIKWYHVRKRRDSSESWEEVAKHYSSTLQSRVTNLVAEKSYYFGVCAENEFGKGGFCDTESAVSIPKRTGPPDPPSMLEASEIGFTQLLLSWQAPEYDGGFPVHAYKVKRQDLARKQWIWSENDVPAKPTAYRITHLKEGINYRFRVAASNEKGLSQYVEADFKTKEILGPPGELTGDLTVSDISASKVTVSWQCVVNGQNPVLNYVLSFKEDSERNWREIEMASDKTQYTLTGLKGDTNYILRVAAKNSKGTSKYLQIEFETAETPGRPSMPVKPLTVVNVGYTDLVLSWQPSEHHGGSPLLSYDVEIIQKKWYNINWDTAASISQNETSCRVQNLKPATQYYFRVCAVNKNGKSKHLELKDGVYTKAMSKPTNPVGPVNFYNKTADSVTFSWQPPEDDGGATVYCYDIEYRNVKDKNWHTVGVLKNVMLSWTQTGLQYDNEYVFRIKACNEKGASEPLEFSYLCEADLHVQEDDSKAINQTEEANVPKERKKTDFSKTQPAASRKSDPSSYTANIGKTFDGSKLVKSQSMRSTKSTEQIKHEDAQEDANKVINQTEEENVPTERKKTDFSQTQPAASRKSDPGSVTANIRKKFEGSKLGKSQSMGSTRSTDQIKHKGKTDEAHLKESATGACKPDGTDIDAANTSDWEKEEDQARKNLKLIGDKKSDPWEKFKVYIEVVDDYMKETFNVPERPLQESNGNKCKLGKEVLPQDLIPYEYSGKDSFLFRSVSCALFGNEESTERLRLISILDGTKNLSFYAQQFFRDKDKAGIMKIAHSCMSEKTIEEFEKDIENQEDLTLLAELTVQMTVREMAIQELNINPFQVQFLCGAINIPILQYFQGNKNYFEEDVNKSEITTPPGYTESKEDMLENCVRILWVSDPKLDSTQKSKLNRIVPVFRKPKK